MNEPNNRLGVYILVSHLLITLAVIILYGITLLMGKDASTLEAIMFVVMGYWFGAITKDSLKSAEKISTQASIDPINTTTTTTVVRKEDSNETQ